MSIIQRRVLGVALTVVVACAATTAVAQGLPSAQEISEMDDASERDADEQAEILAQEDAMDDADGPPASADEGSEESEDVEDDGDDIEASEDSGDEEGEDGWETPLRNPISPVINQEGSMGFHGIASAVSPGPLQFQVGLLAEATGGSSFIRFNDQHRSWGGTILVNGSVNDYFGAHIGIEARNNVNTFGRPQAMLAQGDMNLGVTGRYPVDDGIWLGGDLNAFVPSSFGGVGLEAGSMSVRPRLLASFEVDQIMGAQPDLYVPVVGHLNIGYRIDNSSNVVPGDTQLDRLERYAYGISEYDLFEIGAGAEFPLPYVTPFLGWKLGIPVNANEGVCDDDRALDCVSEVGGSAFPQMLSVGAKGEPVDNLGVHFGMDIGLTGEQAEGLPATVPYNFQFGVSWAIDPLPQIEIRETEIETEVEVEAPRGVLVGRILDEESGEPVPGASITYIDREVSPQLSAGETGLFTSYGFAPGEDMVLELAHPDYETAYADWTVEEGSEERELSMEPIMQMATVRGQVRYVEGAPVSLTDVTVRADSGQVFYAETDREGYFDVEVLAGGATVAAMADGYRTAGVYIETEPDQELETELELVEADDERAVLQGTQIGLEEDLEFESGSATLLDRSYELLDEVAALILENPEVGNIEVQGHTDDEGEPDELVELSQARADAVRDALIERGVSPQRVSSDGHGSASPLVPNMSSRNRAMNRRIEFHVIE